MTDKSELPKKLLLSRSFDPRPLASLSPTLSRRDACRDAGDRAKLPLLLTPLTNIPAGGTGAVAERELTAQ
jgi:hypothetical protein